MRRGRRPGREWSRDQAALNRSYRYRQKLHLKLNILFGQTSYGRSEEIDLYFLRVP
jgi:hypothetical protein